jgi:hypothetical protein
MYYKGIEITENTDSYSFMLPVHNDIKDIVLYEYVTVPRLILAQQVIDKYVF